jgi:hypothetical protein
MDEPDHVGRVDVDRGVHQPVVGQALWPERVDFKHRDHRAATRCRAFLNGILDRTLSGAARDEQREQQRADENIPLPRQPGSP